MEKIRSKSFNLILYDEDNTHKQALEKIKSNYDYALILHDKDTDENGEIKKEHYHVVLRFKNAKWNTALSEELGIEVNYIQESRSLKRSLLYLIHFYDEDKHQYDISEVKGTLTSRLKEYIRNDDKTESEKVMEILNEIDESEYVIDFRIFVKHIANIGYWDVYRRSASIINHYIELHNSDVLHGDITHNVKLT